MAASQSYPCGAEVAPLPPTAPPSVPVVRGTWDGFGIYLEAPGYPCQGQLISEHPTLTGAARALTVAKAALERIPS